MKVAVPAAVTCGLTRMVMVVDPLFCDPDGISCAPSLTVQEIVRVVSLPELVGFCPVAAYSTSSRAYRATSIALPSPTAG
jgi:hypothetical protein